MKVVKPRRPDPDRIYPQEDAEPIMTVTLGLELSFSLRLPEVAFVHSRRGPGWAVGAPVERSPKAARGQG
jgi:hypothetical protein